MRQSKGFILATMLVVVGLAGSVVGRSCSPTGDGGEGLPSVPGDEALPISPRSGYPPEPFGNGDMARSPLARVAEILDIDQQRLEDAFNQARSEVGNAAPDVNQHEALLARVAEILRIEQQDLEDAFSQAHSEMGNRAPWQRSASGTPGPWGAKEE
jgi:hypothetical protein